MARIKPQALLNQSKRKKGPARISATTIFLCNLVVVVIVLSLVATYKHWSQRSRNQPVSGLSTFKDTANSLTESKKYDLPGYAILNTSKGYITVELYKDGSPMIVDNFLDLCQKEYFKGLPFHHVIKHYVIQAGHGQGLGAAEDWTTKGKLHSRLATSTGFELFITTAPIPDLNDKLLVFGRTVKGEDVVQVFEIANQRVKGKNQHNNSNEDSLMDLDNQEDPFLAFIDYARSILSPVEGDEDGEIYDPSTNGSESTGPGWSWIASRILKTCIAYSSGVTSAILLSDLSQAWSEQRRSGVSRKRPEIISHLKKKHRRNKLANTVTIDSVYEKNFLSLNSVLEAVIVDAFVLPGTNIYMLTLGDFRSSNTIDLYLHRRYYDLVDPQSGILKRGREIFLTGCYLRTAREGSGSTRLLPTEYLVILLDDDQDDDAMLIAAQFCSDSFSSISFNEASTGVSYSLYARIESIQSKEIQGTSGSVQRKEITLVDNDGVRLEFLLWGEQVLLANLFSVGSMLALDRPYIASSAESSIETSHELCLEYGSATQLFLVPFLQHEEQVYIPLTLNRYQGSRLMSTGDPTQGFKVSQVALPCDSQGSVDFCSYPFQSFVTDLRDKMTSISLYGVVADIFRERKAAEVIFSLKIEDTTGAIWAKLHFARSWSFGRVGIGHTVYLSGLSCHLRKHSGLEATWYDNAAGAFFVNLSCLPALLNSSCLHKLSRLSDLSSEASCTYICRVRLDQVDQCHVNTRFSHSLCGHVVNKMPSGDAECSFCHCNCDAEVVRTFHLKITLADETGKVFAWCIGQTATELLQISPDEFYDLPEDEQFMYPSSLENESFVVALVNCQRQGYGLSQSITQEADAIPWEITRALRCE
uniref:PPIase cyclophilin-type domain-containing protein n=1 Tax=Salix viminalis TaxID=40686 RepID=A0A6N2MYV5_SALVM